MDPSPNLQDIANPTVAQEAGQAVGADHICSEGHAVNAQTTMSSGDNCGPVPLTSRFYVDEKQL